MRLFSECRACDVGFGSVRKLIALSILCAEALAAFWLGAACWMLSGWYVDDTRAFAMTDRDWLITALIRVSSCAFAALVFGLVSRWIIARAVGHVHAPLAVVARRMSFALPAVAVALSVASAARFVALRPYM